MKALSSFLTGAFLIASFYVNAQSVSIEQAEIRPVAGVSGSGPQFSVIMFVNGIENLKSIHIDFYSDKSPGTISMDIEQVTEENHRFMLSSGARFPVNGNPIIFNIRPPQSYNPEMRQARITITSQDGDKSETIVTHW